MRRSHDSYKHKAEREKPETKEDRRTDGPDPEQGLLPGTDQGSPKSWCSPASLLPTDKNQSREHNCQSPALQVLSRKKDSNSPLLNGARSQEKFRHQSGANSVTQNDRFWWKKSWIKILKKNIACKRLLKNVYWKKTIQDTISAPQGTTWRRNGWETVEYYHSCQTIMCLLL